MHIKTLVGVHSYILISITDRADGVSCFEHKISLQLEIEFFSSFTCLSVLFYIFVNKSFSLHDGIWECGPETAEMGKEKGKGKGELGLG